MERNKKIIHLNNFIQSIPTAIINNNLLINNFSEIAKALTSHDYSAKVAIVFNPPSDFQIVNILITFHP